MEMNGRLGIESSGTAGDCAEAESREKETAMDSSSCDDTETIPCAVIKPTGDSEFRTSVAVKDSAADSHALPLLQSQVEDTVNVSESKPCSGTDLKEADNCAESESCDGTYGKKVGSTESDHFVKNQRNEAADEQCEGEELANEAKNDAVVEPNEVINDTEMEPCSENHALETFDNGNLELFSCSKETKEAPNEAKNDAVVEPNEVINDTEMEPCAENHALEKFDNGKLELFSCSNEAKEAPNDSGLDPCPTNEVKEPTNDDIYSEVSNPTMSPKHVTSSLTINSQPLDGRASDHVGCGEITSVCSTDAFADGSVCDGEHNKCKSETIATDSVVLEIPKHVRPTGIRKITFKFSKRKEDRDNDLSVAVNSLTGDKIHEDFYGNQFGSATEHFHSHEFNAMDGREFHGTCVPNRELKMSKKIVPYSYPTTVKKLLSTKILEGARVKYISISGRKEIPGIIKGCGYLCGCCICNFSKVVNAYEFELHAGTKTRHPNNHIYLENGKPIHCILQELRTASLSTLDGVIKAVAGSSLNEEYFQLWKANLQYGNDVAYADSVHNSEHFDIYHPTTSYPGEGSPLSSSCQYSLFNQQSYIEAPLEQKRLIKKPRHTFSSSFLEHKKSAEVGNRKRDNDLHKLLFMPNGLPDGTSLAYYSKGKKILGGYKQGNGIVCSCCNSEISPSQFEAHAGWAAKRQPYRHIYTSSGLTLHDIALMLANGQTLAASDSDDMCAVCGDRGELIICNGCPRAFHAACLGLQSLPTDDWHCPYCRDKPCPGRKASGESRPIIVRLNRVVKAPEFEPGGCVICRSQDFSAVKFDDLTVIICDQCEKEYHVGCLRDSGLCDLKELPEDKWFCCDDCFKIFEALQNLACSGSEVIPSSVGATLYKKHANAGLDHMSDNDIHWCILNGKSRLPEHLLLLSKAAAIFRECFDPIVARSGRDLIPVMVYGRNISGQEFSGMYCVVLIVKSVVVSAALLRIFGRDVAELPLVATNRENQGKGYFQVLFSCIERLLSSMSVKHLVLPAAEDAEPMWTNKLGFRKTNNEQMLKYTRDFQLTIFKGTSLLEKEVIQQVAD